MIKSCKCREYKKVTLIQRYSDPPGVVGEVLWRTQWECNVWLKVGMTRVTHIKIQANETVSLIHYQKHCFLKYMACRSCFKICKKKVGG